MSGSLGCLLLRAFPGTPCTNTMTELLAVYHEAYPHMVGEMDPHPTHSLLFQCTTPYGEMKLKQ
eukprot:5896374-Pleurochrysis_carterae.AAC.1